MDLLWVILFLVVYYIRPQEWFTFFSTIRFALIIMTGAGFSLASQGRLRLGQLLRTPHDWMVLLFYVWLVIASPTPWETFKDTYNLIGYYFIIMLTLDTVPRIKLFLGW